jgi:short subunit dehydrogenase-like uncharacterized protein
MGTAEIPWMLEMRQRYEKEAEQKRICIVHSCGFDSVPADITALLAVDYIRNTLKMYVFSALQPIIDQNLKVMHESLFEDYIGSKS